MAHDSALESIAALRPRSLPELATIKGVGPAFVEHDRDGVLALIGEERPLTSQLVAGRLTPCSQARLQFALSDTDPSLKPDDFCT